MAVAVGIMEATVGLPLAMTETSITVPMAVAVGIGVVAMLVAMLVAETLVEVISAVATSAVVVVVAIGKPEFETIERPRNHSVGVFISTLS